MVRSARYVKVPKTFWAGIWMFGLGAPERDLPRGTRLSESDAGGRSEAPDEAVWLR